MTEVELKEISKEIDVIYKKVSILDPDNPIENSQRERLLKRWDFLDHKLDVASVYARRSEFRVIEGNKLTF